MSDTEDSTQFALSYLTLRWIVGVLGVALPLVPVVGDLTIGSSGRLQDSISGYIDTVMRGVFLGVLFAVGVFLFTYVGYPAEKQGWRLTRLGMSGFRTMLPGTWPVSSPWVWPCFLSAETAS